MPTPMPIIAATCGAKLGVVKIRATTPMPAIEIAMPIRAVAIGRPIAISDPNAMSSTMIAATMPMTSLAGIEFSPNHAPANCTFTPAAFTGAARSLTCRGDVLRMVVVAVRGSDASDGDRPVRREQEWLHADHTVHVGDPSQVPVDLRLVPFEPANTIWASSPCCCGKSFAIRS